MQIAERDRLLASVRDSVDPIISKIDSGSLTVPADIRRNIEQAWAELDRVEMASERLPSLGLVTERGGGSPGGSIPSGQA
jgi:hypothetical protein